MKDNYTFLFDLEELQYRLSGGVALVWALHEGMAGGPNDAKSYIDALFGAYCYLQQLSDELEALINSQYPEKGGTAV